MYELNTYSGPAPYVVLELLYFAIHFAERMTFYHSAQVQHTYTHNNSIIYFILFIRPILSNRLCQNEKLHSTEESIVDFIKQKLVGFRANG